MSDLQELWKAHSKEWASLGPIAIRRIISVKDNRKLELAKQMEDVDSSKQIAKEVLENFLKNTGTLKPAWRELAESDMTGDEATDLIEAMFLYALRAIEESNGAMAVHLWADNEKVWERKLPSAAMSFLRKAYYQRIRPESLAAFKGEMSV